jgi:hypothetical protein
MLRNAVRGGYNAVIQVDLRPRVERSDPRQRWIEKIEADFAKRAQAAVQSVDSGRNGKSKHFSKGRIAKLHNWLETQADGTNLAKTDHAGMKNDDDTPFEDPTLSSKNCKFHVKTALNASNDNADSVLVSELAAEHLQSERYTLDTKILAARRNMSTNEHIVIPPRSGRKVKLRLMRGGEREKCTPKTCVGVVDISYDGLVYDQVMTNLSGDLAMVYLINESLVELDLSKGTLVGTFEEIDSQEGSIQAILDTTFKENASETLSSVKTGMKTGAPVANKKQKQFIKDNTSIAHLSQGTQKKLLQILYDNFEAVSYGEFDLGNCQTTKHKLFLKTEQPSWVSQFPIPLQQFEEMKRILKEWHKMGIIEKSDSPYNSPIFMVRKKSLDEQGNPKWRLVVDYRKLNNISFPECFRLPLISECLNKVARPPRVLYEFRPSLGVY